MKTRKTLFAYGAFSAILCLLPLLAFPQTPFYEGKTITIIQSTSPGGTGDLRVRALASVLRKHIPGSPTLVMEYMPGGGGRKAGNYIYRTARPDGLTIGALSTSIVPNAVLETSGVLYDLRRFVYLGAIYSGTHEVFFTRKDAGLNTLEKLRAVSGVRVGAQEVGHVNYINGRVFAYVLGMREPRFVTGYSGPEVDAAIIQGEVDARVTPPDTILRRHREWIEKGLVDFHAILDVPKGQKHPHPAFVKLSDLESFAGSPRERELVAVVRVFRMIGQPQVLPPGTPRERVQILEEAMRKSFKDPDFYKEYKKLTGDETVPLMPEELESAIKNLPREPEIIDLLKKLAGPDALPPR